MEYNILQCLLMQSYEAYLRKLIEKYMQISICTPTI